MAKFQAEREEKKFLNFYHESLEVENGEFVNKILCWNMTPRKVCQDSTMIIAIVPNMLCREISLMNSIFEQSCSVRAQI